MSELITDEMVVATAKRLDPDAWEMTAGDYQDAYGRSYGNSESFIRSARQTAMSKARAILRLAAPLIAAKALNDAADEFSARLPDGTGNGRAYNSYSVAWLLRTRAQAALETGANND